MTTLFDAKPRESCDKRGKTVCTCHEGRHGIHSMYGQCRNHDITQNFNRKTNDGLAFLSNFVLIHNVIRNVMFPTFANVAYTCTLANLYHIFVRIIVNGRPQKTYCAVNPFCFPYNTPSHYHHDA